VGRYQPGAGVATPGSGRLGALRLAWVAEGFPDALGSRCADALVDREGLTQAVQALVVVAVLDVGAAKSLESARFLWGGADVAGDGQRPGVLVAGPAGGGRAERELAETVQRLGLADQVTEFTEQCQGLLVAGGGGRVVPGLLLYEAEVVERVGLAEPVTEVAEQCQGLPLGGGGGRVVPGFLLHDAEFVEGAGLAVLIAEVTEQRQGLPLAGSGGRKVPGQVLQQAHAHEGPCLAASVTEPATQGQGLQVAGGGGRVVSGQHAQEAQFVEGVSLAGPVTGIPVER